MRLSCAVPAQRKAAWLAVSLCRMPPALCGLEGPADAAAGTARTPPRYNAGALRRLNSGTVDIGQTNNSVVTT